MITIYFKQNPRDNLICPKSSIHHLSLTFSSIPPSFQDFKLQISMVNGRL